MANRLISTDDPVHVTATMRCVVAADAADAKAFVWAAAMEGIPTLVLRDPTATTGLRFHVAVPADMADSPRVWLLSLRGGEIRTCTGPSHLKHDPTCIQLVPGVEVR